MLDDIKKTLWTTADKLRANMDAAEYKHLVLGLTFVKYISDTFAARRAELTVRLSNPADPYYYGDAAPEDLEAELEDRDYYTEVNAFWVPEPARWESLRASAKQVDIGKRIALLRETNTTLEAITQGLFNSWFVDFDPVHPKMEGRAPEDMDEAKAALFPGGFDESALGLLPSGWRVATLAESFDLNPTRKLLKGSMASYLDMASLGTSGHCIEPPIQREMGSGAKFRNGDTLLARITPCFENGKSAFVDFLTEGQIGWCSTEFLVLRPKAPLPEFFGYLLCRHSAFREYAIQSMSGTSGRQRIQNDVLGRYLLVIPCREIALVFGDVIEPIQKSIAANHETAQTLATLRDTLLPRLISGQLCLPEAKALLEKVCA